jgi:hypothetical protein
MKVFTACGAIICCPVRAPFDPGATTSGRLYFPKRIVKADMKPSGSRCCMKIVVAKDESLLSDIVCVAGYHRFTQLLNRFDKIKQKDSAE